MTTRLVKNTVMMTTTLVKNTVMMTTNKTKPRIENDNSNTIVISNVTFLTFYKNNLIKRFGIHWNYYQILHMALQYMPFQILIQLCQNTYWNCIRSYNIPIDIYNQMKIIMSVPFPSYEFIWACFARIVGLGIYFIGFCVFTPYVKTVITLFKDICCCLWFMGD